jgi:hypothetical protein
MEWLVGELATMSVFSEPLLILNATFDKRGAFILRELQTC